MLNTTTYITMYIVQKKCAFLTFKNVRPRRSRILRRVYFIRADYEYKNIIYIFLHFASIETFLQTLHKQNYYFIKRLTKIGDTQHSSIIKI